MIIGKVIGEVVSTKKHPGHEGIKLFLIRQLSLSDEAQGAPFIAVDVLDAGVGDKVLMTMDGWAAMTAVKRMKTPIDAAVIGVIDEVRLDLEPETEPAGVGAHRDR